MYFHPTPSTVYYLNVAKLRKVQFLDLFKLFIVHLFFVLFSFHFRNHSLRSHFIPEGH